MNKKYITLLVLLVLALVSGIVYYTRTPDPVTVDATGARTTDYKLLAEKNRKEKTVYYRVRYQWFLVGETGDVERQATHYTSKKKIATSINEFDSDLADIQTMIQESIKQDPTRPFKENSIRILPPGFVRLACDKTYDPEGKLKLCYDGTNPVPDLIKL